MYSPNYTASPITITYHAVQKILYTRYCDILQITVVLSIAHHNIYCTQAIIVKCCPTLYSMHIKGENGLQNSSCKIILYKLATQAYPSIAVR